MTSRDFCYWLQGWFEISGTVSPVEGASKETLDMIARHLAMVFKHEIDPSFGGKDKQNALTDIHSISSDLKTLINC